LANFGTKTAIFDKKNRKTSFFMDFWVKTLPK